ncbi:MAG: hypothetical protein WCT04_19865 [Planctomycetota bacterium]
MRPPVLMAMVPVVGNELTASIRKRPPLVPPAIVMPPLNELLPLKRKSPEVALLRVNDLPIPVMLLLMTILPDESTFTTLAVAFPKLTGIVSVPEPCVF